ncbi:MAG: acyltransferase [Actinomycetota bacterium]
MGDIVRGRGVRRRLRRLAGEGARWASARWNDLAAADETSRLARGFGRFGAGTVIIHPRGAVYGESYIHLGADTLVGPHVTLSVGMLPDQQMVTDPVIRIGDGCLLGRGTSVVGHYEIVIGDDVFTGMNVYITDQNHTYTDPEVPVGRQPPSESPVHIGDGTWIGSGAVILPGARIGRQVVVAANAVVRGTVPDHCVVAGVPARIVRRRVGDEGAGAGPDGDGAASAWPRVTDLRHPAPTTAPTPPAASTPTTGADADDRL